jgi:hypothetical protein
MGTIRVKDDGRQFNCLSWAVRFAIATLLLVSATAWAEQDSDAVGCDPNLNPAPPETFYQREVRQACENHPGCRMVFAMMRGTCRAATFMRNVADRVRSALSIDNNVVADAATPAYPPSAAADRAVSMARDTARPSPNQTTVRETMRMPNGREAYAETQTGSNYLYSRGTIIYSDGEIARGEITNRVNGDSRLIGRELRGNGQRITPDGRMQAGPYFSHGEGIGGTGISAYLAGPGVTTYREPDGRTSILEGTFSDQAPDGEMIRRFSDGTSRREMWRRGTRLAIGELSAPGGVPPRIGQYSVPLPVWGPGILEGTYIDRDPTGRQRILLWCNRQVVAVGEFAQPGAQPVHPQPRECPNPGSYRNGGLAVVGPDFRTRGEFWCRGTMTAATAWYSPSEPQRGFNPMPRCEDPTPTQIAEGDTEHTDAVQHTMRPARPDFATGGSRPDRVSGPPWPCNSEYVSWMQATDPTALAQWPPERWWAQYNFSLLQAVGMSAPNRTRSFSSYDSYMATHPNHASEPNFNGWARGFFEDPQYLRAFANDLDAYSSGFRPRDAMRVHYTACLMRYKAG